MFFGLQERQLDDKGRVALPASWRTGLGERCYLSAGENRCIEVVAADDFETRVAEMSARVRAGDVPMSRLRQLTHMASEAQIDRQGRVKLSEHLRVYAQITVPSKLIVAGNYDRVEIWSESVYHEESARLTSELARGDL
jgi:MraZ protein